MGLVWVRWTHIVVRDICLLILIFPHLCFCTWHFKKCLKWFSVKGSSILYIQRNVETGYRNNSTGPYSLSLPGCILSAWSGFLSSAQVSIRCASSETDLHLITQTLLWPVPSCLLWFWPPILAGDSYLDVTYPHIVSKPKMDSPILIFPRCVLNLAITSLLMPDPLLLFPVPNLAIF